MASKALKTDETTDTEQTPGQALQASVPAGLPASLADAFAADAGRGTSQAAEDNIVPLIYILQAQSPQVLPRNPKQIAGAAASNIWLRNSPVEIVDGEQGILFQPVDFVKSYNEWKPRDDGGGFIARYLAIPADAVQATDAKTGRVKYMRPNGNEIIETREHYGIVYGGEAGLKDHPGLAMSYLIPMSGSGHTVSRNWMSTMNQFTLPGSTDKVYPSYARRYLMKTVIRKNAAGEWFTWAVSDGGWVPDEATYLRGRALYGALRRGEKRADVAERVDEDDAADSTVV